MTSTINIKPDAKGYFGIYGGSYVPEELNKSLGDIIDAYNNLVPSKEFQAELNDLYNHYSGRPTPIFYAANLSQGGAKIYLKREDLNHTGAHKLNHCLGEALIAKKLGKKKVIAETGAGQHGIAMATACALLNIECAIYMGEKDVQKEYPNVLKMKTLGAEVVSVKTGGKGLKEAVDEAFSVYMADPVNIMYAIGSVVGPHPFPALVGEFQGVVGKEAREQFLLDTGKLPDYVMACVGGGSNSMGIFSGFVNDKDVKLIGVEPAGKGLETGIHAAPIAKGKDGIFHGFKSKFMLDENNEALPTHSVASGMDYLGVGPQHAYLDSLGRVQYVSATDKETIDAFFELSRKEGIIPALESSHALAYAIKFAKTLSQDKTIIVNLSGRGEKDLDFVLENFGKEYNVEI